jgi:hypothetical protein
MNWGSNAARVDLDSGDTVSSLAPGKSIQLRQLAKLSNDWTSNVHGVFMDDLLGGARLFARIAPHGSSPIKDQVRRSMLYSPKANRKLS